MLKATETPTTRRGLLAVSGAIAALGPVGTAAAHAEAGHPDAELLAACQRFQAIRAEMTPIYSLSDALPATEESRAAEATLDRLQAEADVLGDLIADTRPRTFDGIRAKAAAIVAFWGGIGNRHAIDLPRMHDRLEWSLVLDLTQET